MIVDCVVNRTVPGGCSINFGQVNHGTSDTDYCSLGGDRGCYSTVSCDMGVQSFSAEQCYNSNWNVGPWNIPCYDTDPSPLNEVWEWNRSVTCPIIGDCDPSMQPASTGACGSIPQAGVCSATTNSCGTGTFTDVVDTPMNHLWTCNGINGGSNANCSNPITPVDGICGIALNNCSAGTFSDVPDTIVDHLWSCMGLGAGLDALNCSRPITAPSPSDCFDSLASSGCTAFTSVTHGATDSWSCDTGYSGTCSAECDNGTFINTSNACTPIPDCPAETINESSVELGFGQRFCNFDLPAGYTGDIENISHNFGLCDWTNAGDADCIGNFTCNGSNWVTNSWSNVCIDGAVDGVCGTILNICDPGVMVDIADSPTEYLWECHGQNGGSDALNCSTPKPAETYSWSIDSSYGNCSVTCGNGNRTRTVTCRQDSDNTVVADANCSGPKPDDSETCVTDTDCKWRWQGHGEVGNTGNCAFNGDSCAGSGYYSLRVCCGAHGSPSGPHSCAPNTPPGVIDPVYYPCKE